MVQTFVNFLKEQKMVRVVIMGGLTGSGKSTYSEYIIRHFGIKHIYPGGLLRKEIDKGGAEGEKIKNLLDKGKFAPNDIVLKLIKKEVAKAPNGYILDGYPRYMQQVKDMQKFGIGYDVVVFLDVDKEEVIRRLTKRAEKMIHLKLYQIELPYTKKKQVQAIDYFRDKKGFISIKEIKVKSGRYCERYYKGNTK